MAFEVRRYSVTIPAGTLAATPHIESLVMPARTVRSILWRVPPGPRGLMGFQIGSSGIQVIPWNTGEWIVAEDESDELELTGQITSGAWQCIGYNLGRYDHTVYLTFALDRAPSPAYGTPGLIPSDGLGSGPGGSGGSGGGGGGADDGSDMDPGGDGSGDGGGGGDGSGDGDGDGDGLPGGPDPDESPDYLAGWAAARTNALAALGATLSVSGAPDPVTRPAAGGDAARGYDDGKAAILATLAALEAPLVPDAPADADGYAIARARAVAAVLGALGGTVATQPPPAPAYGTDDRTEYDAGKAAALAVLEGL